MSTFKKFIERLRKLPKDVAFDELHKILIGSNVNWQFRVKGSHYIYYMQVGDKKRTLASIPRHIGKVKPIYLHKVIELLEEQGVLDDED